MRSPLLIKITCEGMTSSVSKMLESKLKLKDTEGDLLKQLELLESSTCHQAIGVFSLYNKLKTVGELWMQHVQHISMCGHIKDFTANKEGNVIATGKLLVGYIPKDTSVGTHLWGVARLRGFEPRADHQKNCCGPSHRPPVAVVFFKQGGRGSARSRLLAIPAKEGASQ